MSRFGIKAAAATRDLAAYQTLAPRNIDYDGKNKVYVRAQWFRPIFLFDASRILTWLAVGYGDVEPLRHRQTIPMEMY